MPMYEVHITRRERIVMRREFPNWPLCETVQDLIDDGTIEINETTADWESSEDEVVLVTLPGI